MSALQDHVLVKHLLNQECRMVAMCELRLWHQISTADDGWHFEWQLVDVVVVTMAMSMAGCSLSLFQSVTKRCKGVTLQHGCLQIYAVHTGPCHLLS